MIKNNLRSRVIIAIIAYATPLITGFFITASSHIYETKPISITNLLNRISHPEFLIIIKHNLSVWMYLLLGTLTFGSATLVNLVYNGFILGSTVGESIKLGLKIHEVLLLTAPHGIFEISAIIIAGAAGFKIPYEVTRYLVGKKDQILVRQDIKEYIALALISIALIVIAAWIEANITMRIAESMLNE